MNYKLAVTILATVFATWIMSDQVPSAFARRNECPHPTFIKKHLCVNCNEDEAMTLSKSRRDTPVNSVLTGNPTFTRKNNDRCVNVEPVPVFNCNVRQNRCHKQGDRCIAEHHTETGHLFYRVIVCH